MHSKAPAATKAQKKLRENARELGCLACIHDGHESMYPIESHHLTDCGFRVGQGVEIPLCQWHHRGVPPNGFNQRGATELCGPSYALDKREFRRVYGSDAELLAFRDYLLKEKSPA